MKNKRKKRMEIVAAAAAVLLCLTLCACGGTGSNKEGGQVSQKEDAAAALRTPEEVPDPASSASSGTTEEPAMEPAKEPEKEPAEEPEKEPAKESQDHQKKKAPTLLYMGQGSIRIVTGEEKVIYIDPYSGDGYDLPADLILVTHDHYDHNRTDLVVNKSEGCRTITQTEALEDGEHHTFDLGFVTVEAVEAGYNQYHNVNECVGYILTFSGGESLYVTGDTSTTPQMPLLAEKKIDYAFFCCDGVYNMDAEEASKCAEMVAAKHSLPYHTSAANDGYNYNRDVAEDFQAEGRIIPEPGDEMKLE